MPPVRWAGVARAAACLGAAAGLAACGTTSSSTATSSVTVSGRTLTIVISVPSGTGADPVAEDVVSAERLAFDRESKAASAHYTLRLAVIKGRELSDVARGAIEDTSAIAYLGEVAPGASEQSVGITNALDIPQVSPTDTALELTQGTSAVAGAPNLFYESHSTYGRTFLRVAPSSAVEAEAQVREMKQAGVSSLDVESDGSDYGRALAAAVRAAARAAGLSLASGTSSAGAVFVGAASPANGARLLNAAASAAPTAKLFGSSSLDTPAFLSAVDSSAASRLLVSTPGVLAKDLPAAGRAFVKTFTTDLGHAPSDEAIFGYAAMSAVLAAIREAGASANDRTSVLKKLRSLRQPGSVLGSLAFSSTGASNQTSFVFNRVKDGALVPVSSVSAGG